MRLCQTEKENSYKLILDIISAAQRIFGVWFMILQSRPSFCGTALFASMKRGGCPYTGNRLLFSIGIFRSDKPVSVHFSFQSFGQK